MRRNQHRVSSILRLASGASIALCTFIGCSAESPSPSPTSPGDVAASYDNLTTDLSVCQKAHDTCLDAADGDAPKVDDCEAEAADCRDAVRASRQEVHAALRECVSTARTCVHSIGDGGMAAVRKCGDAFHECVKAALPPPPPLPPCVQTLRDCLSPGADGAAPDRAACLSEFRTCAIAGLPPCMKGLATCLNDGGSLRECLPPARECRTYRLTHDGGVPPM
ncbi:MAG TPA: hypothetical protein VHE30_07745 [Polyangiaceae bacterium]|nr:hypothetical protein [Polyangiaceae bacterium]